MSGLLCFHFGKIWEKMLCQTKKSCSQSAPLSMASSQARFTHGLLRFLLHCHGCTFLFFTVLIRPYSNLWSAKHRCTCLFSAMRTLQAAQSLCFEKHSSTHSSPQHHSQPLIGVSFRQKQQDQTTYTIHSIGRFGPKTST